MFFVVLVLCRYANILVGKLKQHVIGVEKSKTTRALLKENIAKLKAEKVNIQPEIEKQIRNLRTLQSQIEKDVSKRYNGRVVALYGVAPFDE